MKIAHFNTHDNGGAGKAAKRLNYALNSHCEYSRLFVKWKSINEDSIIQITSNEVDNKVFDKIGLKYFYSNIYQGNTICSLMYPSVGFNYLDILKDFDIVNLHWISSFVSVEAIMKMEQMGKKIVWTLHDQNPFTGACHYSHGCEKFKSDCSACPQLLQNNNIAELILNTKFENMPKNITIVTPSKWLAQCASESKLFKNNRIEVIPNSVELDIYKPISKNEAKRSLGINENCKVILFGANDIKERRKGYHYLIEASKFLVQNSYIVELIEKNKLIILSFGHNDEELEQIKIPFKSLGYIYDDSKLVEVYNAADVLVLPSLEDNLPNLILESLACGTPLVAFTSGGIKEYIFDEITGVPCSTGNAWELSEGIIKILNSPSYAEKCREFAINKFSSHIQAESYIELYKELSKLNDSVNINKNIPLIVPENAVFLGEYFCEASKEIHDEIKEMKYNYDILKDEKNLLAKNLNNEKEKHKEEIIDLNEEFNNLKEEFNKLLIEIDIKNEAIKSLKSDKANLEVIQLEKLNIINELEEKNLEQKNTIIELDKEKNEFNNYIAELKQTNISLEQEKQQLINEIQNYYNTIEAVFSSNSWKITKPIRFTIRNIKRFLKFWTPYAIVRLYQKIRYGK